MCERGRYIDIRSFSNVPLAATSDDSFSYHRHLFPAFCPFTFLAAFLSFFPLDIQDDLGLHNNKICRISRRFFLNFK